MSFIPFYALQFGGQSLNESRVSYDKTRISGSTKVSYILHSKGGCMPGQQHLFTTSSTTSPGLGASITSNPVIDAFKRERYLDSKNSIGTKYPKTNRDNYTYDEYVPNDDESLDLAIKASYRQVFGNFFLMESERPIELERRLRNGDLVIREFIRLLAKSPFYKTHYFESVNQQRSIELSFKHLLGRPPKNLKEVVKHIELIQEEGFDYHIDSLIDSIEYQENFGPYAVPYQRCWDSPCGSTTTSFINTAALTRGFATSDNAIHGRKTLSDAKSGTSQLLKNLTSPSPNEIIIPQHAEYLVKQKEEYVRLLKEKLEADLENEPNTTSNLNN